MADATQLTLTPHNPAWARQASLEAARIATALTEAIIHVEHIGSTAIPRIVAKPTIDLMPVARGPGVLDACRAPMEALGYFWRGEYGIPGRRYSVLEREGRRIFHVHMFATGDAHIARHLAFRDYLRAHGEEALAYEAVKRAAAAAHPHDSLAYTNQKSGWIRDCLERAQAWAAPG